MGIFTRDDSPWFWMLLEGTDRKKERIDIRRDATDPEQRKENRLAAEAIYHSRMRELALRRAGLPTDSGMTFDQRADWFDTHVIATHSSHLSERSILKTLRTFFGRHRLTDIRKALVAEYEAQRFKAGRKRNTVTREISILRTVIGSAVGEHIDVDPLAGLKQKHVRLKPKRTLAGHEEPALLAALLEMDPELHDLYLVGVGTLLRQGNLVGILRSHHRGGYLVADTKTGPHTVSLTGPTELQTRAAETLTRRWPASARAPFFPKWHARFSTPGIHPATPRSELLIVFRRAIKAAGLPWGLDHDGLVWHTATRATGATRLMREYGVDIRTIQRMGPWASLDQMAEYLGIDVGNAAGTKGRNDRPSRSPLVPVRDL